MSQKQPLVLVIDDDAHMRHMLQLQISKSGAQVLLANHGQSGLEIATEQTPDLIIADYQMPVLDGFQMCVQLRQNPKTANIPIIMLTGRGHKLTEEQRAQTNILHMMGKPFSANALLETVQTLIEQVDPGVAVAAETL